MSLNNYISKDSGGRNTGNLAEINSVEFRKLKFSVLDKTKLIHKYIEIIHCSMMITLKDTNKIEIYNLS